jgi:hypothetical protein
MEKINKIDVSPVFSPLFAQIFEIKAAVFTILEIQKKEMTKEKQELYKDLYSKNLTKEISFFAEHHPGIIPDWEKIKNDFKI